MYLNIQHVTLLHWNLLIAVGILSSLGQKLDPVLDLGHPGIHPVAGTLAAKAHHSNLEKSKIDQL